MHQRLTLDLANSKSAGKRTVAEQKLQRALGGAAAHALSWKPNQGGKWGPLSDRRHRATLGKKVTQMKAHLEKKKSQDCSGQGEEKNITFIFHIIFIRPVHKLLPASKKSLQQHLLGRGLF